MEVRSRIPAAGMPSPMHTSCNFCCWHLALTVLHGFVCILALPHVHQHLPLTSCPQALVAQAALHPAAALRVRLMCSLSHFCAQLQLPSSSLRLSPALQLHSLQIDRQHAAHIHQLSRQLAMRLAWQIPVLMSGNLCISHAVRRRPGRPGWQGRLSDRLPGLQVLDC